MIRPATTVTGVLALALALLPAFAGAFTISLFNYVGIYTLVVLGLVLLTGCGGLTSFGQAAFVGIGAYATAVLTTRLGLSPWLGLIAAMVLTAAVALILGYVTLHLGGHYLPLTTIAWGMAIYLSFGNFEFLGHYGGIGEIPPVTLFGFAFEHTPDMYYLIWVIAAACLLAAANLLRSRQGRAIRALRGGNIMAASLGIDVFRLRLSVFVVAALLAGLGGWLYAHLQRFVSPAPFDLRASIELLLMAVVGGAGHIGGALAGAVSVALVKNWLQDLLPYLTRDSANLEIVVFGALFILLLQRSQSGLVPWLMAYMPALSRIEKPAMPAADPLPARAMPTRGGPLLEVDDLTKTFGGLTAVDHVSFRVQSGEILALIGPNGAGKSTTFNLITGIVKPASGRILFAGHDLARVPPRDMNRLGIGRTFQHVKLRPTMSVLENVMLGAYARTRAGFVRGALGLDREEERAARAAAWHQLDRVGLTGRADEPAGSLPLGQRRLVEVARALAGDPLLLMLDEPAAGLRSLEKEALASLLRSLRTDGLTILLVEHDMDFVMTLADRVVVLVFGKQLTAGAPAEVQANPAVQEAYLGSVG